MKTITVEDFKKEFEKQGRERREDITFKCPRCGTVQSAQELIDAGAGDDFESVQGYLGFSCVGRFDDSKGCDWTLGGLLRIHTLEVIDVDGKRYPHFEAAMREGEEIETTKETTNQ